MLVLRNIESLKNHLPLIQSNLGSIITSLQLASVLSYANEVNEATRTPYSKFAAKTNKDARLIPSKIGMLMLYTPAMIISFILEFQSPYKPSSLAGLLCFLHFLKRVMEVLFVHKYSGGMPLWTALFISVYYSLNSSLVCCVSSSKTSDISRFLGVGLFTLGIAGNGYHHLLLARLRKTSQSGENSVKYVAPRGGLFEYVAAPHYLFELMTWLGIAFTSENLNVFLVFVSMSSYLAGRSVAQNQWNRQTFSETEWPSTRRNLIPAIF